MKKHLRKKHSPPRNLRLRTRKPGEPAAELTILIDVPNARTARSIQESLQPETLSTKGFRSKTTVSAIGKQVRLRIEAEDLVALRAASNSFLHFVAVSLKAIRSVAPFYRGLRRS